MSDSKKMPILTTHNLVRGPIERAWNSGGVAQMAEELIAQDVLLLGAIDKVRKLVMSGQDLEIHPSNGPEWDSAVKYMNGHRHGAQAIQLRIAAAMKANATDGEMPETAASLVLAHCAREAEKQISRTERATDGDGWIRRR